MTDEIPQWALEEAVCRINVEASAVMYQSPADHELSVVRAFARMIAKHEQEPVDALLLEAREIAAKAFEACDLVSTAEMLRAGELDDEEQVQIALTALRRGIEIAKERGE